MYILTGGAGFIGSCLLAKLNEMGVDKILVVDNLQKSSKWKNLVGKNFDSYLHKNKFLEKINDSKNFFGNPAAIIHMGACSSTTEKDINYLMQNNYQYTVDLCSWANKKGARFIYASSAATYGDGSAGFKEDLSLLNSLHPINGYGYSKHLFDLWAAKNLLFNKIVGLKFFNVFGPNEYHKNNMRSMVLKAFYQIKKSGKVRLFKSQNKDYKDGEQLRDFLYIKDCVDIIWQLIQKPEVSGLFNLGSGKTQSWNILAENIFMAMNKKLNIEYFDMPKDIAGSYQYFTQADLTSLNSYGVEYSISPLKNSVKDYIKNYLDKKEVGYI